MKCRLSISLGGLLILAFLLGSAPFSLAKASHAAAAPTPTVAPIDYKVHWNLSDIYPDQDAWEKDFKQVKEEYIPKYKTYEGKLGDAAVFLEFQKMDEAASRTNDKLLVYATLKQDENTANSAATENASRAQSLSVEFYAAYSFVRPELLSLPEATLQNYIKDPSLAEYQQLLQSILDTRAHTLSKPEEAILAKSQDLGSAPGNISSKIREADLEFPKVRDPQGVDVQLGESNFATLLENPNRAFREKVYKGVLGAYGGMKNSLASALDAQVRSDYFYATERKYNSSLDASLESNHIPKEVYTALVDAANKNLDTLHNYVTLRKNVLKLDKVRIFDFQVPLVSGYKLKEVPYSDAQAQLLVMLKPLGDDYVNDLKTGFNSGWIDVYPAENKATGAYSWGAYDTHPFVLHNYDDSFSSELTLAHEFGHAMNSFYVNKAQNYYNSSTPIFNAEVASTTNELIVLRSMIANAKDDQEKLYFLDQLASDIQLTFFKQVMYAEFELQIHERVEKGDALSVESLNKMWGDLLTKYYGPDFELTEEAKLGWSRIPHFYRNFYVYQYATGIAAANAFSTSLMANTPDEIATYRTFLEAGSSAYPVTVLKNAGVDMLTSKPVDDLLTVFDDTISGMNDMFVKLGKMKK